MANGASMLEDTSEQILSMFIDTHTRARVAGHCKAGGEK
jgi:hypothetical protein